MVTAVRAVAQIVAALTVKAIDAIRGPQAVTGWTPTHGDYEEQD